MLIAQMQNHV